MARRILLINPLGTDMFDQLTVDLVQPHLAPDTEVVCRSLGDSVPPSPFLGPPHTWHNQLLSIVAGAASEGFLAVGISCAGDPGLAPAKAATSIPVTAPFEAVSAIARTLGSLCVVQRKLPRPFQEQMPTQRDGLWMRSLLKSYGADLDRITFRSVAVERHPDPQTTAQLAANDPNKLRDMVLDAMAASLDPGGVRQAKEAVANHGARAIFFACTFWGGLLEPVAQAVDVPVLDPLLVVAKYTEYLAAVA